MTRRPARTLLITGASDGIGRALARRYDAAGARLVLTGSRPREALDDPLFARHTTVAADLRRPREATATLLAAVDALGLERLDALVLGAAVGSFGPVALESPERLDAQLAVNLEAPLRLVRALLPRVLAARGTLAFVSSVAADAPCPDYAVYAATKTALDGFARALRVELGGRARVLVLHPGATRTGMHVRAGADPAEVARVGARWPSPERVAAALGRAIDGRARQRTVGLGNRLARGLCRWLPGLVERGRRARSPSGARLAPAAGGPGRALVTGAADGLGRALALGLAARGARVVGVDRDAGRLAALSGVVPDATLRLADLGDRAQVAGLSAGLPADGPYDLVVHNAGISAVGAFARSDPETQAAVLEVNLRAPLALTRALLAGGALRPGATLVFVSSLSHQVGYPGAAAYAASKDGLAAYARSLAVALRKDGLRVLRVFPGPLRTEHARRHAPPGADEAGRMPPEEAAEAILDAVARGRRTLVPGLRNRLAAGLGRWCPGLMDRLMRRLILDPVERAARLRGEAAEDGTRPGGVGDAPRAR